ncbi:MAG: hypothetical protein AAF790_03830 [Planctomycetota bacterium]
MLSHKRCGPGRSIQRTAGAATSVAVLLLVAGCGNGLATVTGQVTLNDTPLAGGGDVRGTVYFFPEGGTGAPAVGLLDAEGRYRIATGSQDGVMPGAYIVTISASKLIPARVEGEAPSGRAITPRKYANPSTSGLRVQVGEGSQEFDFALQGPPDRTRR